MNIKVGDNVIVISGSRKDKNKQGKVLKTFKDTDTVVIEGVNIKKKITRDPSGKKVIVEVEFPLHASNVMFYDEAAKKGSRIGYIMKDGNKVRVAKASGTELK
ncbi:MAG: large subunit ribosomal protein L24 [Candidatus Paceibacteria bacterium]|jgi:large subunit ribosomal protein L24